MSSMRAAVMRQFGRPSGVLGRLAGFIMERRPSNRARSMKTLEALGIEPEDRVLEIGFGPGFALTRAAELAARGHVVGVDHSEVMLRRAAQRNRATIAAGRMELHCSSVADFTFASGSIDKAYAVNVVMFWPDPVSILQRVRPALRAGGRLALTHQPRQPGATQKDTRKSAERLTEWLLAAGFEDIRVETLQLQPVNAACVLARVARSS